MKVRGWVVVGVALAALWVLVRGVPLAPETVADGVVLRALAGLAGEALFGLIVGVPVAYLFRRTFPATVDLRRWLSVLPAGLVYVAVFLRELTVATVDVTYRVVAPGPPVDPEVIYVPLRVESEPAVTTIANTITLTPGTIALDHDPEGNALFVHVIDGRDLEAVVSPIRTWEDNALTIFGEDATGTEQPPQVLVTGDEVADVGEVREGGGDRGQ